MKIFERVKRHRSFTDMVKTGLRMGKTDFYKLVVFLKYGLVYSGIMQHRFHCISLAVTAIYFNRLCFVMTKDK